VHADARVIAATNRDLRRLDAAGGFRADLFYRLGGFHIAIPRCASGRRTSRPGGLLHREGRAAAAPRGAPPGLTTAALAALQRYSWPGNVRELRNVVERAVLLCGSAIDLEHLPLEITMNAGAGTAPGTGDGYIFLEHGKTPAATFHQEENKSVPFSLKEARELEHAGTERRLLEEALERFRGNKRAVARHLGIDPKTLYRLLKKHGIFAAGGE